MHIYDVAGLQSGGKKLLLIPVEATFGTLALIEQREFTCCLQRNAEHQGLIGTVLPVWEDGRGHLTSTDPKQWQMLFHELDYDSLRKIINAHLVCNVHEQIVERRTEKN